MIIDPVSNRISGFFSKKSKSEKKFKSSGTKGDLLEGVSMDGESQDSFLSELEVKKKQKIFSNDKEKRRLVAKWIGELEHRSDDLIHAPSIKSFVLYRTTLSKILNLATEAYEIQVKHHDTEQGRTKEFLTVGVISQELDSLLALIRERAQSPLAIASKVISIKGLVLDFIS